MSKDAEALANFINESWQAMLTLMRRARAIAFRIRIAAEVHGQATFEKHVREFFATAADRMILVPQSADRPAHYYPQSS